MFSPIFMKAWMSAGVLSQVLAVIVCLLFKEFEMIPKESASLGLWLALYVFHKRIGTF